MYFYSCTFLKPLPYFLPRAAARRNKRLMLRAILFCPVRNVSWDGEKKNFQTFEVPPITRRNAPDPRVHARERVRAYTGVQTRATACLSAPRGPAVYS